jgi:hypothetical protein
MPTFFVFDLGMTSYGNTDPSCRQAPANMLPPTPSKASTVDLLSSDNFASEDDGDTVSLGLDSVSEIATTMSTGSRTPSTEAGEWMSSRASSATTPHKRDIPSVLTPSAASLQQSSTSQSPNVEAGYSALPDPLPSREGVFQSPATVESSSATPTGSARGAVEDKIATELCGSPRLKRVRDARNPPLKAMATAEEGKNDFLPLLNDEPNYPTQPSIVEKLSIISKQPTNTQVLTKKNPAQPNAKLQSPTIHPALRQTESQSASHDEQMLALNTEFRSIANDLKSLIQSTSSKQLRLSEDVDSLQKNQDRLLRGWEGMRNELLELKESQQQLKQHVDSTRGSDKQSTQSARPSMAFAGLRGPSFASPARQIRENTGLQGPAFKVPDPLAPYFRDRKPPKSHTSTLIPNARAREGRQSAERHTAKDTMSARSTQADHQRLPQPDHHAEHARQFPQGCRWRYCPICQSGDFS